MTQTQKAFYGLQTREASPGRVQKIQPCKDPEQLPKRANRKKDLDNSHGSCQPSAAASWNGCNSRFYPVIFQGLQHDGWDAWTCKNWQPVCSKQAESQANPQNMQWDKQENNSCLWEGKIHNQWVSQNQNSQSSLGKERIMWNFTFVSWLWTSDTDL